MKGLKKLLLVGLTAGVFSSSVTWALRENAWLVLPVFIVCVIVVGWTWDSKFKRKWRDAALKNTVNVTREQMNRLTNCGSQEEFALVCSIFQLDYELLMKNYPFFKWDD
jgi:hypothetical protein